MGLCWSYVVSGIGGAARCVAPVQRLVLVSNTDGQRGELVQALEAILAAGKLGRKEDLRLRGDYSLQLVRVLAVWARQPCQLSQVMLTAMEQTSSAAGQYWH